MNNFTIIFVIIITILLIFGVNLILKPETRKKGIFIISSIIIVIVIRYCFINYTFMGINYFVDALTKDLSEILQGIMMVTFLACPVAFLIGLFLTIKGNKYLKIGLYFVIGSIIAFIIGISNCGGLIF